MNARPALAHRGGVVVADTAFGAVATPPVRQVVRGGRCEAVP